MQIHPLATSEPFKLVHFGRYTLGGGIISALSASHELSIEVTFDRTQCDPGQLLFVNLVTLDGRKRGHLSIRPGQNCIVLNTKTDGVWGQDTSCNLDFGLLRYWRLWLVLGQDGILSSRLESQTLCTISLGFRPQDVAAIESDVSAIPALLPAKSTNSISGLFDLAAENGPTLMIQYPIHSNDVAAPLEFLRSYEKIHIDESRTLQIGNCVWLLCILKGLNLSRLEVAFGGRSGCIFDVRSFPVVELAPSSVSVRTIAADEIDEVFWKSSTNEGRAPSKIKFVTDERNDSLCFAYSVAPLSSILGLVGATNAHNEAVLRAAGVPIRLYTMNVGPELYLALEEWVDRVLTGLPNLPPEWQLIVLDWWSVLGHSSQSSAFRTIAPSLFEFLNNQNDLIGTGTSFPDAEFLGSAMGDTALGVGPRAEEIALWVTMRSVANQIASAEGQGTEISKLLGAAMLALPVAERSWFALQVASRLIELNLDSILLNSISIDFAASMLVDPKLVWQYSSICVWFATRGDFEKCIEIFKALVKEVEVRNFEDLNISAVSTAIRIFILSNVDLKLRKRFRKSVFILVEALGNAECNSFRHVHLLSVLVDLLFACRREAVGFQDDVLSFVESQFHSVPEFWIQVFQRLDGEPRDQYLALIEEVAEGASRGITLFRNFLAHQLSEQHGSGEPSIAIVSSVRRHFYLGNFLRLHCPATGPVLIGETFADHDWLVRQASLPNGFNSQKYEAMNSRLAIRNAIDQMQHHPKVAMRRFLDSLGAFALNRDFEAIKACVQNILSNDLITDPWTEAVAIDVAVWALLESHGPLDLLGSLVVQILRRLRSIKDKVDFPAALHSAMSRILGMDFSQPELNKQALELINEYLAVFPPEVERTKDGAIHPRLKSDGRTFYSDTVIAIVTCQKYLATRARECRETWVRDAEALGITVLYFCGRPSEAYEIDRSDTEKTIFLDVGDAYEDLPAKSLAVFRWIELNTSFNFALKIDDDCYLDAQNYFLSLSYRRGHYFGRPLVAFAKTFDRAWHQSRSVRSDSRRALDTSLLNSRYADGGGSYALSRFGVVSLSRAYRTSFGRQVHLASFFEDKMIGDLLASCGISVSDAGYNGMQARRNHSSAIPVLQIDRTYYPTDLSGISVAHLDETGLMSSIRAKRRDSFLSPPRFFPLNRELSLSYDANMLELLGNTFPSEAVQKARFVCVSTFRNEGAILRHFLDHYRALGIDLFLVVDNLSDDGTREYLSHQGDVVLFSAASEYRNSHYGVDWQRILLDHFCAGRWVVVADADEFLVTEGAHPMDLRKQCAALETEGYDAAVALMVDMYPRDSIAGADFSTSSPFICATAFDSVPVRRWRPNRGPFGNFESYVSSLRHRLMALSSPEMFTSQKVALFRFHPLMAFSEGFHFAAGVMLAPRPLAFLHFKYSSDFAEKAAREVQRMQHFGGAREYRAYLSLIEGGISSFWEDGISEEFSYSDLDPLARLLKGVDKL